MTKYKLALDEQETTINYSRADKNAFVLTHDAKIIKYLRSVSAKELHVNDGFIPEGVNFEVPISWIKIRKPMTRVMTDEQKHENAERLKLARSKNSDTAS